MAVHGPLWEFAATVLEGPQHGLSVRCSFGEDGGPLVVTVGRKPSAINGDSNVVGALILKNDPLVSGNHCSIVLLRGTDFSWSMRVTDHQSVNGTTVFASEAACAAGRDGRSLAKSTESLQITSGSVLRIGSSVLLIRCEPAGSAVLHENTAPLQVASPARSTDALASRPTAAPKVIDTVAAVPAASPSTSLKKEDASSVGSDSDSLDAFLASGARAWKCDTSACSCAADAAAAAVVAVLSEGPVIGIGTEQCVVEALGRQRRALQLVDEQIARLHRMRTCVLEIQALQLSRAPTSTATGTVSTSSVIGFSGMQHLSSVVQPSAASTNAVCGSGKLDDERIIICDTTEIIDLPKVSEPLSNPSRPPPACVPGVDAAFSLSAATAANNVVMSVFDAVDETRVSQRAVAKRVALARRHRASALPIITSASSKPDGVAPIVKPCDDSAEVIIATATVAHAVANVVSKTSISIGGVVINDDAADVVRQRRPRARRGSSSATGRGAIKRRALVDAPDVRAVLPVPVSGAVTVEAAAQQKPRKRKGATDEALRRRSPLRINPASSAIEQLDELFPGIAVSKEHATMSSVADAGESECLLRAPSDPGDVQPRATQSSLAAERGHAKAAKQSSNRDATIAHSSGGLRWAKCATLPPFDEAASPMPNRRVSRGISLWDVTTGGTSATTAGVRDANVDVTDGDAFLACGYSQGLFDAGVITLEPRDSPRRVETGDIAVAAFASQRPSRKELSSYCRPSDVGDAYVTMAVTSDLTSLDDRALQINDTTIHQPAGIAEENDASIVYQPAVESTALPTSDLFVAVNDESHVRRPPDDKAHGDCVHDSRAAVTPIQSTTTHRFYSATTVAPSTGAAAATGLASDEDCADLIGVSRAFDAIVDENVVAPGTDTQARDAAGSKTPLLHYEADDSDGYDSDVIVQPKVAARRVSFAPQAGAVAEERDDNAFNDTGDVPPQPEGGKWQHATPATRSGPRFNLDNLEHMSQGELVACAEHYGLNPAVLGVHELRVELNTVRSALHNNPELAGRTPATDCRRVNTTSELHTEAAIEAPRRSPEMAEAANYDDGGDASTSTEFSLSQQVILLIRSDATLHDNVTLQQPTRFPDLLQRARATGIKASVDALRDACDRKKIALSQRWLK